MSEPPHDPTSGAPSEPPVAPAPRYIPWVTVVLAAANIAVWLVTIGLGADPLTPSAQWMFEHGGNAGPFTLAGEEWRTAGRARAPGGLTVTPAADTRSGLLWEVVPWSR